MRLIDADAYAAEMKKRQDACMDVMADAHSDRMYTENEHWAGVLAAFAEAKITLDKMPTVSGWVSVKDRLPTYAELKCEEVLVLLDDGNIQSIFYDECIEGESIFGMWVQDFDPVSLGTTDSYWAPLNGVTHWMPLPEQPKEVSVDG